jgi:hypothetical protein
MRGRLRVDAGICQTSRRADSEIETAGRFEISLPPDRRVRENSRAAAVIGRTRKATYHSAQRSSRAAYGSGLQ